MLQACTRCVYDQRIPAIEFDDDGVCSYCKQQDELEANYPTGEEGRRRLEALAEEIKRAGKGKKYDCVIGVSGGCDSSYLLHLAKKELGLRPLAVHFDNTWNSKIAVENIQKMLEKLDIDLYTHVVDNEEFCDISRAFMEASVPELDAPTDVALTTTLYMAAARHKIRYILDGHSFRTEGIGPIGWFYFDGKYVGDIHQRFGKLPMKTYPNLWFMRWMRWLFMRIKRPRPLYYVDFQKEKIKEFLTDEYGWTWYGGHHLENRFTAFNHQYVLPKKFDRDLRYTELSALVRSGQVSRDAALDILKTPREEPKNIIEEVKKRLGLSDEEFERLMRLPNKTPADYKTYRSLFVLLRPYFWVMMKLEMVPRSFYVKYCFR